MDLTMSFIQGVGLDNIDTRDQNYAPTKLYKKGKKFLKIGGKIASGSIKFVTPFLDILTAAGVSSHTAPFEHIRKGITLTCTVIETPKTISEILVQAKDFSKKQGEKLLEHITEVAFNVSSVAIGIMSCFSLGDTIIAFCDSIASSVGNGFNVVQTGLSATLPFIGVFSAIQLVKGIADTGIESFKLYKTAQKISATTEKMKIWTNMDWNDPTHISNKLSRSRVKQIHTVEELEKLEGGIKTSLLTLESRVLYVDKRWRKLETRKKELIDKNIVERVFGQVMPHIKLTVALLKKDGAEKNHLSALKAFNKLSKKHTVRSIKIRNYAIIEGKIKAKTLNSRDLSVLGQFKTNQLSKLDIKKSNLKIEAIGHGIKIGIKVVIVISCIAGLALTFSGVGTMPGVLTNASVALFVMAAEYGLKKFKEYLPPKAWIPVKVPRLLDIAIQ